MKNLKRLAPAVALTFVIGISAFADCTNPGEVHSPPCIAAQSTPGDGVAPGETSAPPASNAGSGYSVTELALGALESMLLIF